ncbi:MAG TPA: ATP-binding cassette domain-containing protein [Gemmatimonadales bacterium]|nr:ATP-binding cassette domain-containing protein [Gemmatimonadales bacterium]
MVELRGVRHRYDGRLVLDLEHFAVPDGAMLAVVGHNGAGKSTLLRLLALLEAPTEGSVVWDGHAVPRRPPTRLRRRVTLVEQRPVLLRGTVLENIGFGLRVRGISGADAYKRTAEVAEQLGLLSLLERRRTELSDGEVQRVAVARALAVRPDVLLLDEPASSADRAAAGAMYRALATERRARPLTICIASHQLEDAYRWADDIRALADGRLSPVTPENLFRVELAPAGTDTMSAHIGAIDILVTTDRAGSAVLAVPPGDIFVSLGALSSSARNVLKGSVTRVASHRGGGGGVAVTADVGVELIAIVTADACRELALAPGAPVVFSFKASAVRVF